MKNCCQQSQKLATYQLQDEDGLTVLHCAAGEGHGTIVSTLLASAPWLADEQTRWVFFGRWADKVIIFVIIFLANKQTRWLSLWLFFWPTSRQGDYLCDDFLANEQTRWLFLHFFSLSSSSWWCGSPCKCSCRRCVLDFCTVYTYQSVRIIVLEEGDESKLMKYILRKHKNANRLCPVNTNWWCLALIKYSLQEKRRAQLAGIATACKWNWRIGRWTFFTYLLICIQLKGFAKATREDNYQERILMNCKRHQIFFFSKYMRQSIVFFFENL